MGTMTGKMSNELRIAFQKGSKSAINCKDSLLRIEHVLYGILTTDNIVSEIITKKLNDFDTFLIDIEDHNKSISEDIQEYRKPDAVLNFEESLRLLIKKCSQKSDDPITVNIFFTTCLDLDNQIIKIMNEYGISKTFMQRRLKQLTPTASNFPLDDNFEKKNTGDNGNKVKSKTPVLDNFSRDLTVLALEGKLDPVIGRDAEIERVAQILTRRKKNNPVLIGDPGVGKCYIKETNICLRNDLTGEIFSISVNGFLTSLTNAK